MKKILIVISACVFGSFLSTSLYAANHPVTGEKLSADQTFTYWHGD